MKAAKHTLTKKKYKPKRQTSQQQQYVTFTSQKSVETNKKSFNTKPKSAPILLRSTSVSQIPRLQSKKSNTLYGGFASSKYKSRLDSNFKLKVNSKKFTTLKSAWETDQRRKQQEKNLYAPAHFTTNDKTSISHGKRNKTQPKSLHVNVNGSPKPDDSARTAYMREFETFEDQMEKRQELAQISGQKSIFDLNSSQLKQLQDLKILRGKKNWKSLKKHVFDLNHISLRHREALSKSKINPIDANIVTNIATNLKITKKNLFAKSQEILLDEYKKWKKTKLLPDAAIMMSLQSPISNYSQVGKHVNFLLTAKFGKLERIKQFIENEQIDVNWCNFINGNNVLHETVIGKHNHVLDYLLDNVEYIDFDYPNNHGLTPILLAALTKNYYAVFKLILRGSDCDFQSTTKKNNQLLYLRQLADDPNLILIDSYTKKMINHKYFDIGSVRKLGSIDRRLKCIIKNAEAVRKLDKTPASQLEYVLKKVRSQQKKKKNKNKKQGLKTVFSNAANAQKHPTLMASELSRQSINETGNENKQVSTIAAANKDNKEHIMSHEGLKPLGGFQLNLNEIIKQSNQIGDDSADFASLSSHFDNVESSESIQHKRDLKHATKMISKMISTIKNERGLGLNKQSRNPSSMIQMNSDVSLIRREIQEIEAKYPDLVELPSERTSRLHDTTKILKHARRVRRRLRRKLKEKEKLKQKRKEKENHSFSQPRHRRDRDNDDDDDSLDTTTTTDTTTVDGKKQGKRNTESVDASFHRFRQRELERSGQTGNHVMSNYGYNANGPSKSGTPTFSFDAMWGNVQRTAAPRSSYKSRSNSISANQNTDDSMSNIANEPQFLSIQNLSSAKNSVRKLKKFNNKIRLSKLKNKLGIDEQESKTTRTSELHILVKPSQTIFHGSTNKLSFNDEAEKRPSTSRITGNNALQMNQAASLMLKISKTASRTRSNRNSRILSNESRSRNSSRNSETEPSFRSSTASSNVSSRTQRQLSLRNCVVNRRLSEIYSESPL